MIPGAQARFDDEIAALTLVLCNLRTQRNTLSPISRLPPEVLASIFIHCAQIYGKNRHTSCTIPAWVNVSYVCHHWRDIALSCSTLWSFLFASNHNWTNELLTRSKAVPLKVRLDFENPKEPRELNLLQKVAPQSYRIQDLCLRLTHREAEHILPLFSSRAPLLQTLQISVERSDYFREPALVSGILFDGDTPALRKLELINYAFTMTSPSLCGLTSLRLRDLDTSFQPKLGELRVALSHMKDLAHLHLENALPSALENFADPSFEDLEKLSLPRLSRLSIVAPFSTVILLLSSFDLPLKTEVRLRCCFETGDEVHTPIYPHLAKRFISSKDEAVGLVPTIRTCFIEAASATVGFTFSTDERDYSRRAFSADTTSYELRLHEDWDCNIPLKVDIVLRTSLSKDREDLIGGICRSMPLTNLQGVQISFDRGTALSCIFWTKTFGHLEELRHLRVSQADLQGLVQALSLSPRHSPKSDLELHLDHMFAPTLEELELYGVKLPQACHGRLQGACICFCCIQCLYDVLSSRQARGHSLRWLTFANCMDICYYDVDCLRDMVTNVHWDGFLM